MDVRLHGFLESKTKVFRLIKIKRKQNAKGEEVPQCDKEVIFRNYSDVSNWENKQLPTGPNLEIPCEWRMLLDTDLP